MQRRSQGDTNLVSLTDIKALERTIKRARLRAMASNPEAVGVDIGQASGEIHAAGSNPEQVPDITAEDAGLYEDALPVRRSPQRQARVPRAAREREYEEEYQRIGEFDEPGTRRPKTGIQVPRIPNANFQMNHGLTQSVQDLRFTGYEGENPLDHLDMFDRLCALYKVNGVPTEALKMMVFPFSLGGQAAMWEKEIPSDLVTTWEDVRKEFLNMFFPKQRTAKARASISGFRQRPGENFHEAWSRFQGYIRSCPHHGFGRDAILGIFYRGCNSRYRELLDSSSGGNFADFTVIEGESLISKMARSGRHVGDDEYDRERTPLRDARVNDVTTKMGGASISQPRSREVRFVEEEPNQEYEESQAELYYIDSRRDLNYRPPYNNGYNARPNLGGASNWRSNNQGAYQPPRPQNQGPYQAPRPQNQGYTRPMANNPIPPSSSREQDAESSHSEGLAEIKRMIQTVIDSQTADRNDINKRISGIVSEFGGKLDTLTGKFNGLEAHVKILEKEITTMVTTTSKSGERRALPGQPEENPRDFAQYFREIAVPIAGEQTSPDDEAQQEMVDLYADNPMLQNMSDEVRGIFKVTDFRRKISRALETMEETTETRHLLKSDPTFVQKYSNLEWKDYLGNLTDWADGPRYDPFEFEPPVKHYIQASEISAHPDSLNRRILRRYSQAAHANYDSDEGPIEQQPDPGPFTIPCIIGDLPFPSCVLDTGASKSVMPLSVCKAIGITAVQRINTTLQLADWSTSVPVGLAKGIDVLFKGHTIRTDFLIVDTGDALLDAVIFGRPFLRTTNAELDNGNGLVDFRIGRTNSKHRVWKDPQFQVEGNPFNSSMADFYMDLVKHVDNLAVCGGKLSRLSEDSELEPTNQRVAHNQTPQFVYRREHISNQTGDGAGPSRYLVGNGKTNEDDSDGEEESPSDHELDPGDIPSTTPGHAPFS